MEAAEAVIRAEHVFDEASHRSRGETPANAAELLFDAATAVRKLLGPFVPDDGDTGYEIDPELI